jgi:galactose mutarotase-like enzyme
MTKLENDFLKITISEKGAELTSIFRKDIQKELLWQADAFSWNRHAPVLFPFVGKLKNNSFKWQDKSYLCSQHGFARDEQFSVMFQSTESVALKLSASQNTLQHFPFPFHLELGYTLIKATLSCTYKVINTGDETMYFSIGAHPGFTCPLFENETLTDYSIMFNQDEYLNRHLLTNGLFDLREEPVITGKFLPLSEVLFAKDAIVLKNIRSSSVTLSSFRHPHKISVSFEGFPYLGIWKKPEARFICIEPWYGLADYVQHNGKLEEKEGIQSLKSNDIFEAAYNIEIH